MTHAENGVNEYIRYRIKASQHEHFIEAYAKAEGHLTDSPVCLGYELSQCEEEPNCFILRIRWRSTADHLGVFRKSDVFPDFLESTRAYIPNIEEMRHYAPTRVSWNAGLLAES